MSNIKTIYEKQIDEILKLDTSFIYFNPNYKMTQSYIFEINNINKPIYKPTYKIIRNGDNLHKQLLL